MVNMMTYEFLFETLNAGSHVGATREYELVKGNSYADIMAKVSLLAMQHAPDRIVFWDAKYDGDSLPAVLHDSEQVFTEDVYNKCEGYAKMIWQHDECGRAFFDIIVEHTCEDDWDTSEWADMCRQADVQCFDDYDDFARQQFGEEVEHEFHDYMDWDALGRDRIEDAAYYYIWRDDELYVCMNNSYIL